ncbi:hypothetical protein HRbin17_01832 [bacterium HR17]|jgi:uncharacterized protein YqeY|uniref:Glutamyl-tRNA(Gln) amidotransferase subunit E n=1 Tax=Candidatus Fervidibacter japonicus TaxID=2035412 RepID=A0A2H5XDQ4_9BACT|nr:hypothetical protein HRbin17_01832 [bacterium HR17]
MNLKERIDADYKTAMKARDELKISVLRLLRSAIHNAEIDKRRALTDDEILGVIQSEARKRRESIEAFEQGGRTDLADRERAELAILEGYLPQALSREELLALVRATVRQVGAFSIRDMGKVMAALMPQVRGRADGREVNELVRQILEGQSPEGQSPIKAQP